MITRKSELALVLALWTVTNFAFGWKVGEYFYSPKSRTVEQIGNPTDIIDAEVVKIYDGDTLTVNIVGWPDIIGKKIEIRLSGIDTPELHDKRPHIRSKAEQAKEFVTNKIGDKKTVQLKNLHRDKYFRIDAEVFIDGKSLNEELLNLKLAVKYDGKTKKNWE